MHFFFLQKTTGANYLGAIIPSVMHRLDYILDMEEGTLVEF